MFNYTCNVNFILLRYSKYLNIDIILFPHLEDQLIKSSKFGYCEAVIKVSGRKL